MSYPFSGFSKEYELDVARMQGAEWDGPIPTMGRVFDEITRQGELEPWVKNMLDRKRRKQTNKERTISEHIAH